MRFRREILKGHLTTIILAALKDDECHAYRLNQRILDTSLGVFNLAEGTLYPTLHKLEKANLVDSRWQERDRKPNIKVYYLTDKGEKELEERRREWSYLQRAMRLLLEPPEQ